MKLASLALLLGAPALLAGCVTVKHQLMEPNVAVRLNSAKTAEAVAHCAAAALPAFRLDQAGQAWSLTRNSGGVLLSRWDFVPTNNGSQAELRNGAHDDGGAAKVEACV